MKPLFYFLIIPSILLCSCNQQTNKNPKDVSITGKWHRFTMTNGYSEFDIDSQHVVFYNHKVGRFKFAYVIENDSFKYLDHNYAAKFSYYGDSLFLKGNDFTTATLYRFKGPDLPFDSIPEEKDSLSFNAYIKGFDQRLILQLEKAGIQFFDPEEEEIDTALYEKLLKSKGQ